LSWITGSSNQSSKISTKQREEQFLSLSADGEAHVHFYLARSYAKAANSGSCKMEIASYLLPLFFDKRIAATAFLSLLES